MNIYENRYRPEEKSKWNLPEYKIWLFSLPFSLPLSRVYLIFSPAQYDINSISLFDLLLYFFDRVSKYVPSIQRHFSVKKKTVCFTSDGFRSIGIKSTVTKTKSIICPFFLFFSLSFCQEAKDIFACVDLWDSSGVCKSLKPGQDVGRGVHRSRSRNLTLFFGSQERDFLSSRLFYCCLKIDLSFPLMQWICVVF